MLPLQARRPSQSPVWQAGFELGPKLQPVLAQSRPVHVKGAFICRVWPEGRKKPPSAIMGCPLFGAVPGHMGNGHLLVT